MSSVWLLGADVRRGQTPVGHLLRYDGRSGSVALAAETHAAVIPVVADAIMGAVPWVVDLDALAAPWHGFAGHVRLAPVGPTSFAPKQLPGASLGLALALHRAARLMGVAVPEDVYATATVGPGGAVGRVDHVDVKSQVLPETARVLVHPANAADVRRGRSVVVEDLAQAFREVFGAEPPRLEPSRARTLARAALYGSGRRPWKAIARALAEQEEQPLVRLALDVARRHAGEPVSLDKRAFDALNDASAPDLFLVAHHLQGLADSAEDGWRDAASLAGRKTGRARSLDHAKVWGALGRLYASWRDYRRAARWLDRALDWYEGRHDEQNASHAACERLRVAGILGERLDERRMAFFGASYLAQSPVDRGYLARALWRHAAHLDDRALAARVGALADAPADPWSAHRGWAAAPTQPEDALLHRILGGDESALVTLSSAATAPDAQGPVDVARFERLRGRKALAPLVAWEWRY